MIARAPATEAVEKGIIEGPGRRSFAIGLAWSPAAPGEVDRAAKEAARAVDCDLFVSRDGDVCQFGLGRRSLGHRAGHRSAALAAVQSARHDDVRDFVVVVDLEESVGGFWCLAVRDDVILADGDQHAADRAAAVLFLERELTTHPYKDIFAPAGFGIENSRQLPLDRWLQDLRSTALRPVERNIVRPLAVALAAIVLVWSAVEAFDAWQIYRQESTAEAARVARVAAERQAREGLRRPWSNVPAPREMARACLEGTSRIPLAPPGWTLERVNCGREPSSAEVAVRVVWRRSGGTLGTLAEAVRTAGPGIHLKPTEQGQLVEASTKAKVGGAGTADPLVPVEALEWAVSSGIQAAGPSFIVAIERQSPQTLAAATGSAPALVVAWARARIEAPADPRLWIGLVERPGVVLASLQFEASIGKWIALAHLYEPVRLVDARTT